MRVHPTLGRRRAEGNHRPLSSTSDGDLLLGEEAAGLVASFLPLSIANQLFVRVTWALGIPRFA